MGCCHIGFPIADIGGAQRAGAQPVEIGRRSGGDDAALRVEELAAVAASIRCREWPY